MKTERSPWRATQGLRGRVPGNGGRPLVECKCPACGQIVNTMMDRLLEGDETVVAFPSRADGMSGKFDEKHPANATDLEKVLRFSQQLYAHALTLQELIRNEGAVRYDVLRPTYDRQAAQQFEIFYNALERPSGFRKPVAGACE